MLQVSKLAFDYGEKNIFSDVDFTVQPGQLLHIKGENGCGKTTLLKILAGLLTPTEGVLYYHSHSIGEIKESYQNDISYVAHQFGLTMALSIYENYALDPRWSVSKQHLAACIHNLQLDAVAHQRCYLLSAGQKKRAALLRLLIISRKLWLLDEPFNALDASSSQILARLINQHLENQGMVILTAHQALHHEFIHYQDYCL